MPIPSGPFARYRASSLALADGASVSAWADESGNGHDLAAIGASAPVLDADGINGHQAVRWDGAAGKILASSSFTAVSQPVTRCVVMQSDTVTGTQVIVDSGTGTTGTQVALFLSSANYSMFAGSVLGSSTRADLLPRLVVGEFNGASSKLFRDGGTIAGGSAGTQSFTRVALGGRPDDSSRFIGRIAEVIDYDRVLTAQELEDLSAYAQETYLSETNDAVTQFGGGTLPGGWSQTAPAGSSISHSHSNYVALTMNQASSFGSATSTPVLDGPRVSTSVSGDFDIAVCLANSVVTSHQQGIDLVAHDGSGNAVRATEYYTTGNARSGLLSAYDTDTGSEFTGSTPSTRGPHEWLRLRRVGSDYTFFTSPSGRFDEWQLWHTWTSAVDATEFAIQASKYDGASDGDREMRIAAAVDLLERGHDGALISPPVPDPAQTVESVDFTGQSSLPAWLTSEVDLGGSVTVEDNVVKLAIDMSTDGSYAWLHGPAGLNQDHGMLMRYRLASPSESNAFLVPVIRGNDSTDLPSSRILVDKYRPGVGMIGEVGTGSTVPGRTIRMLTTHPVTANLSISIAEFGAFSYIVDTVDGPVNHHHATTPPWIWVRFEAVGSRGRVKYWYGGQTEPDLWTYEWTDYTQIDGHSMHVVWAHNDGTTGGTSTAEISNIEVYSLSTTPTTRWYRGDGVALKPYLKTPGGLIELE